MLKNISPYLVFITAIIIGIFLLIAQNQAVEAPHKNSDNQNIPVINKSKSTELLEQKLKEVINNYPGYNIGVSVKSLNSELSADINSNQEFIGASTTKVIVASYTYAQADKGIIDMDSIMNVTDKPPEYVPKTFRENVRLMIVKSDNESWKDLKEYFGYNNIENFANNSGAKSYDSANNTINSSDMSEFLKQLQKKPLINQPNLDELLQFMSISWTGPLNLDQSYQDLQKKAGWYSDRLHLVGYIGSKESLMSFSIYTETAQGESYIYADGSALINTILSAITENPI
jgi:hypothetical protein